MSREYSLSLGGMTTVSAVVTLAFINPKAAAPASALEIIRVWVSQSGTPTSAQQRVQTNYQVTAFPTLTSRTPTALKLNDPASGIVGGTAGAAGTSGVNATAEGAGAKTTIHEDNFNILSGWLWVSTPLETVIVPAVSASGFGVHLPAAPGNPAGWAVGVIYREL